MKTGAIIRQWIPGLCIAMLCWAGTSCIKRQPTTENTSSPCSDFNKTLNVHESYDESQAYDLAQYASGGGITTYTWKIVAADACENGPLTLDAHITLAADTSVKVKMGYWFERQQTEKTLSCKYSSSYSGTINSQPATLMDVVNAETSVNHCTSCNGVRPSPLDFYIQMSFPSTGFIDKDRARLRNMVKAIDLKMGYVQY